MMRPMEMRNSDCGMRNSEACHSERSEESPTCHCRSAEILRCAQDDARAASSRRALLLHSLLHFLEHVRVYLGHVPHVVADLVADRLVHVLCGQFGVAGGIVV